MSINYKKAFKHHVIIDSFNKLFYEIGEPLANKFSSYSKFDYKKLLKDPSSLSMFLYNTNTTEIIDTIRNLKNSNSTGHDKFSSKFLKLSLPILAPAVEKKINLSLSSGIYPEILKKGEVIPS